MLRDELGTPPQTIEIPDDLEEFCQKFFRVKTKKMDSRPFTFNRMQQHLLPRLTGRDIILKARQIGVSVLVQAFQEWTAMFQMANVATFADIYNNVEKLRDYGNYFYDAWPVDLLAARPARGMNSIKKVTYPATNSVSIIATAGSKTAGQAGTISHLHLSEFAYYEDQEAIMRSALQAATPTARIVIESTANGAQGDFYDMCMRAMRGEGKWALHFYAWWWADEYSTALEPGETLGDYTEAEQIAIGKARKQGFDLTPEQIKWRRDKISEEFKGDVDRFLQEYPESINDAFMRSGKSVFGPYQAFVIDDGEDGFDLPEEERMAYPRYAGLDWGQDIDYTELSISDRKFNREVFLGRWNKMDWDVIRREVRKALRYWNVQFIRPERNSMGSSQIFELAKEMETEGLEFTIVPVVMNNTIKKELVLFLRDGLLDHGYKVIDRGYANQEMAAFITKRTSSGLYQYEASGNNHDDTVIARMLSYAGMFSFE